MNKKVEHGIQTYTMNTLIGAGFYVDRVNSGKIQAFSNGKTYWILLAKKGTPDIIAHRKCPHGCCSCAQLVRAEIKQPKGRLDFDQEVRIKELEDAGALCPIIRSEEDAIKLKMSL